MIKDIYRLADIYGVAKDVYIASLLCSSENKMFEEIIKLLPYCEKIEKLNGVCMKCGSKLGSYSFYIKGNKDHEIEIGGEDNYQIRCKECYDLGVWTNEV